MIVGAFVNGEKEHIKVLNKLNTWGRPIIMINRPNKRHILGHQNSSHFLDFPILARKQKHSWAAQPQGPHKVGNQSNHGLQPQRLAMPTLSFTTISIQACLSGGLLANPFPVPPFQVFGWMLVDVSQLWPVDFVYLRGLMLRGLMILMIGIPWKQYGDDTCSKVFIHCIT